MTLTATKSTAIISTKPVTHLLDYSCRSMRRFEARKSKGVGYTPHGVWLFLCPKSILRTLKNLSLWWGGWLERYSLYTALQTNFLPHRPKIEALSGGLSLSKGDSHMTNHAQKPLTIPVSHIKDPVLLDNIINEIFRTIGTCQFTEKNALEYGELSRLEVESLKRDAEYLIIACDKALRTPRPPKHTLTSRFNVLAKGTRRLLVSRVTFEQAIQCHAYENTVIKFAGMVGGIA